MKALLLTIFLLTFNSVRANELYACIHLIQNSAGGVLSSEDYAYVEGNRPCPSPHNFMNLFNSELQKANSNENYNMVPNQLQNSKPIEMGNDNLENMLFQKTNKTSLFRMVTEPECIWYKSHLPVNSE